MRTLTALLGLFLLLGCGAGTQGALLPMEGLEGAKEETSGFQRGAWGVKQGRLFAASLDGRTIVVANSGAASGISFVPASKPHPPAFAVRLLASLEKEGLDGGWGLEFGLGEGQGVYRVLLYSSGRFCLDREEAGVPQFIHCVNRLAWVKTGEVDNEVLVSAVGSHLEVWVNGRRAVEFDDPRYRVGRLALAAAGSGARVRFKEIQVWRLRGGIK
jgi:hypothetical protein